MHHPYAIVAQLVEHWLPKPRVAGSSPVYRSFLFSTRNTMNYGFVKVAAAVPQVKVADCKFNAEQIQSLILQANNNQVEVVVFPELSLTSYTCADLFAQQTLLEETEQQLIALMNLTRSMDIICIVGMPIAYGSGLLNSAVVIQKGKLLGIVPKTYLPNHKEFYEKRWFTSAMDIAEGHVLVCGQQVLVSTQQLFRTPTFTFGIELCEDLWAPVPPSSQLALKGAEVIFNLSADNDLVGKRCYLDSLVAQQSARLICGYVYAGCGYGESTQDIVFRGKALIYENGSRLVSDTQQEQNEMLAITEIDIERIRSERRQNTTFAGNARMVKDMPVQCIETAKIIVPDFKITRSINPHPFVPAGEDLDKHCREVLDVQTYGLAKRIEHTQCKTLVVGISGGLDSTLALLVCIRTIDMLKRDRRDIVGVTMPGFGTSDRTYTNAMQLMRQLGITVREISIKEACIQHFKDIDHDINTHDVTYENGQARERTQILMDVANQLNGLVVGTGDLSELALGWATYNGDHMSMYNVNGSVPKTLVKHLVAWEANNMEEASRTTLLDIVDTPISPELIPTDQKGNIAQVTEDLVGPYELHDFFLYHLLRWGFRPRKIFMLAQLAFNGQYEDTVIKHWLSTFCRRFFAQQFKRSCQPDGPKVGSISLSPRGDWRMPSDACSRAWLEECKNL